MALCVFVNGLIFTHKVAYIFPKRLDFAKLHVLPNLHEKDDEDDKYDEDDKDDEDDEEEN